MIRLGVLGWLFMMSFALQGQSIKDEIPTNFTSHKRVDHKKYAPKVKSYSKLYSKSTKKTLYGNPCATDVTKNMGFLFVPLSQGRGKTAMGVFINNLYVKSKLVVTRTPFWKLILNKRLDDCRTKSGDGVG